jgi:proteic killer suppression protein
MRNAQVILSKRATKDLQKIPRFLQVNFHRWVTYLTEVGYEETQKVKGFHDEPLKGLREGQRSVRLNRAYRVFYQVIAETQEVIILNILEINKHEY